MPGPKKASVLSEVLSSLVSATLFTERERAQMEYMYIPRGAYPHLNNNTLYFFSRRLALFAISLRVSSQGEAITPDAARI